MKLNISEVFGLSARQTFRSPSQRRSFVTRLIDAHNKRLTQRDTRVCLGDAAQTGEWTVQGVLSGLGFEQHILQGLFPNPGLVRKQLGVSG